MAIWVDSSVITDTVNLRIGATLNCGRQSKWLEKGSGDVDPSMGRTRD